MSELEEALKKIVEPVAEQVVRRLLEEGRPAEPDKYLSVKHAAELLDVPEPTIRKWLQRGPAHALPGARLCPRPSLGIAPGRGLR